MVVWQTFFDSSDPLHYAPLVVRNPPAGLASKNVYMSWSETDSFSPEPTLTTMARAMGLPVASPLIKDINSGMVARPVSGNVAGGDAVNRTAACYQYAADGFDGPQYINIDETIALTLNPGEVIAFLYGAFDARGGHNGVFQMDFNDGNGFINMSTVTDIQNAGLIVSSTPI